MRSVYVLIVRPSERMTIVVPSRRFLLPHNLLRAAWPVIRVDGGICMPSAMKQCSRPSVVACRQRRGPHAAISARGAGGRLPVSHGPQLAGAIRRFLFRIVPGQSEHFLELSGATMRAVWKGVIEVAIIQALLAGVGFRLAAIPSAGLLGLAVMLLSIAQIGAAVVPS
jgi:hypothetical protein